MTKIKNQIKSFCEKHNITEAQFFGKENIEGYLYLRSVTSIPEGFNPTVGGSLDLGSVTSIPEGFNPTVGGYLDLRSVTSIPEGFNPTVGGDLDLRSVTSIPEGLNPTVGGDLYWKNNQKHIGATVPQIPAVRLNWKRGKYQKIDGIFCEIISKKTSKGLIILLAKKLNSKKSFFIAQGKKMFAHGETIKKAVEDLQFKIVAEKLKKEPIKKDTIITIQYFRLITGACEMGVKNWMQQNKITKEKIKAIDLLPLLEKTKAYGLDRFKKLITF